MSKKEWIGAFLIAGLWLGGKHLLISGGPRDAHANATQPKSSPARPTAMDSHGARLLAQYRGPRLVPTEWVTQNQHDPMTGQDSYYAVLMSRNGSDTRAALGFKCADEASLMLTIMGSDADVSNIDHMNFDAKEGDGGVFQAYGLKLGASGDNLVFQLDPDQFQNLIQDGTPLYLRFESNRRVYTMAFVPANTEAALEPIKACKH